MGRRRFGREFKIEAVRLTRDRGVSVAQASRDLDVHENLLRKWAHDLASDPAQALRLFGSVVNDGNVNTRARAAIEEAGLTNRSDTIANFMSHGEQRQLEIAMVLATEPRVILLDEPLAGMGQAEALRMIELIRRLKMGRAVLLVEHDMDAVFALVDRLTVMADGKMIASGSPDHVRNHPDVRAAYLGHGHGHEHAAGDQQPPDQQGSFRWTVNGWHEGARALPCATVVGSSPSH